LIEIIRILGMALLDWNGAVRDAADRSRLVR
jgi:hypothetical protein